MQSVLQKVHNMSSQDTVHTLSNDIFSVHMTVSSRDRKIKRQPFKLPHKHVDNLRVFTYLRSRGIDSEIINHCINHGILYLKMQSTIMRCLLDVMKTGRKNMLRYAVRFQTLRFELIKR